MPKLFYVGAVLERELAGDPVLALPGFRIGKNGAEKTFETALRGKAGSRQVEVNAHGRIIRELRRDEGQPGDDHILTVDMGLQEYANARISHESASAVVIDVHSGELMALVSSPSFNPNSFTTGISQTEWNALMANPRFPLTNKAVSGQYSPGSTFKMMVALAALEGGHIDPAGEVFCTGHLDLGNRRFHCWKRGGHGPLDRAAYGTSVSKRNKRRNMGHHMFVDRELGDESYTRAAYQRYLKKFLRCVKGVDDNVGRLLDYLEKSGELDNTVIFYTGDQGFMLGEHDYIDKRWMYEESMRMPLLVRYPPMIKAGSRNNELVNNTDFAPTILALAGVKTPGYMQGRSFSEMLRGNIPGDWRTATYYRYWMHMAHHWNPAHFGIRTKGHKLIFYYGLPISGKENATLPAWELYDMEKDPREMNNVYADPAYARIRTKLKAELKRVRGELKEEDTSAAIREVIEKHWKD